MAARLLTLNGGSSSLKFALFEPADPPRRLQAGVIERIGMPESVFRSSEASGNAVQHEVIGACSHVQAAERLIRRLEREA